MRSSRSARRHITAFVRVSVVALLAGLLHVVIAAPASAAVPTGVVDALNSPSPGRIYTGGWAFDPDETSRFVTIHVYVGGYGVNIGEAKLYRPDVNQVYGVGDYHGFDTVLDVPVVGDVPWEVYGIDTQGGPPALIGSGRVTIAARDTTAPQTTITSAPKTATTQDIVHVTFSANEPNASFECRWDLQPWFVCQSGTTVSLTPGNHQVSVRATDQAGNTDPTPAVFVVVVTEATAPPPPPGQPGQAGRTVTARAVKKKSKLRIDVGPDSVSSNYRVVIQRKVGKKWRRVDRARTRGGKDVVVVNLRRGKYRVVLPKSAEGPSVRSGAVRLKR